MSLSMNRSTLLRAEYDDEIMYEQQPRTGSNLGFNKEVTFVPSTKPFSVTTQTGKNVGKVRWLQNNNTTQLIPDTYSTEHFLSASTGESKSEISLWRLTVLQDAYGLGSKVDILDTIESSATVTDLVAVSDELMALTTSNGSLCIYKCPQNEDGTFNRIEHLSTNNLHRQIIGSFPCPAIALTTNGSTIVTVGEDGSIFEMSTSNEVVRSLERVDPLSICCVANVGRSEILTGNNGGQLKLWDLRRNEKCPVLTMNPNIVMNTVYGTVNMAVHPSQNHLVIVAYQSGCMDLYDIRMGYGREPIANLASDSGSLSELYFHQINPDHFFSCSQSGQVNQWYPGHQVFDMQDNIQCTPDVNIEFLKRGLVFRQLYSSPLPVNSFNLSKNDRLVSGGDNGVLFCTEICANN